MIRPYGLISIHSMEQTIKEPNKEIIRVTDSCTFNSVSKKRRKKKRADALIKSIEKSTKKR